MGFGKILKLGRTFPLLDTIHEVAFLLQLLHSLLGCLEVFPIHTVLSSKGGLVDFCIRRSGCDTTEIHRLHTESIAGAEDTSHIIQRSHIIEDNYQGKLLCLLELLHREAIHFYRS